MSSAVILVPLSVVRHGWNGEAPYAALAFALGVYSVWALWRYVQKKRAGDI